MAINILQNQKTDAQSMVDYYASLLKANPSNTEAQNGFNQNLQTLNKITAAEKAGFKNPNNDVAHQKGYDFNSDLNKFIQSNGVTVQPTPTLQQYQADKLKQSFITDATKQGLDTSSYGKAADYLAPSTAVTNESTNAASGLSASMRAGMTPAQIQAYYDKIDKPSLSQLMPSTTPTAPQTTAPTGPGITSNLGPGSNGADVQKLQQWLVSQGLLSQADMATGPGIYGPKTTAAVTAWQQKNGIDTQGNPGYFGPISRQFLQGNGSASVSAPNTGNTAPNSSPAVTNNGTNNVTTQNGGNNTSTNSASTIVSFNGKNYDVGTQANVQLFNAMSPFLQGAKIDPNMDLTPDVINQILEKAKTTVHPEFAQQIAGIQEDLGRNTGALTSSYNRNIDQTKQDFTTNLGTARENYAGNGLAFSGARGTGELNMQADQNRNLAGLSASYGSQMGDLARNYEKSLGTAGTNGYTPPPLTDYKAQLSGNGSLIGNGNVDTGYNPGTYQLGTVPQAETAAALALRNQNVDEASKRKVAGQSYLDLYQ